MSPKPTVPEVLPIVNALYARHSAGCCWHIVLDDGNVDDDSVRWCAEEMGRRPCDEAAEGPECVLLCDLLPRMTRTQRRKLCAMHT